MTRGAVGAVVIGGYASGLELVRALGSRRIPVAVVRTKPYDMAHRSRFACEHHEVFDLHRRPDTLLALLDRQARRWSGWALYPCNDHALQAIGRHHDRLARRFVPVAPPWSVVRELTDKSRLNAVAERVGLDLPRCYGPAEPSTARREDLEFPVVVKPDEGHRFFERFGRKLFTAPDRGSLLGRIEALRSAGLGGEVRELVPGNDACFYNYAVYIDERGEPGVGRAMHKLRKGPPFYGVCRVAELCRRPELHEPTVELLRAIGYRGMANAEYKRDPRDGRYRFMEVNGRPFLMQGLARRGGVDLPMMAWQERVGRQRVRAEPNDWPGVWIHLHADLLYAALFRRQEGLSLGDYLGPYRRRPKAFAVWSRRDPKPFVAQWAHTLAEGRGLWSAGARARLRERVQARPGGFASGA